MIAMEGFLTADTHILHSYYCICFHGPDKLKLHDESSFVMILIIVIFLSLS